jgi:hypothetical protein
MNDNVSAVPAVKIEEPKVKAAKQPKPKPVKKAPAKKAVKKPVAKKARKVVRKAKRRAFPYLRVAKLWAQGKTIESIARSIGRFEKSADDPLHSMRCFLHRMHSVGYINGNGKRVKLPHRVSRKSVKLSAKAGRKAAA